jgi:hypothetical protein
MFSLVLVGYFLQAGLAISVPVWLFFLSLRDNLTNSIRRTNDEERERGGGVISFWKSSQGVTHIAWIVCTGYKIK